MAGLQTKYDVFVVYPGALFSWWEVVRDGDDADPVCFDTREQAVAYAHAVAAAGLRNVVKVENWFGETEAVWEVSGQVAGITASTENSAARARPVI